MFRNVSAGILIFLVAIVIAGCAHNAALHSSQERSMTLGIVQKELRQGMDQPSVAAALGSPNMVTRDSTGRETWVYDKVATESSYSESSGNVGGTVGAGGIAGDVLIGGKASGSYGRSRGASATTQKTLTVIIKFDQNGLVENYTSHMSTF